MRTPVGYRCRECVSQQQQVFETALWYDYAIAAAIAAPLAALGSFSAALGFFVIFLAPVVGGVAAEAVRWGVRRRRGRYLSLAAAGAFVVGCLPVLFFAALSVLLGGGRGLWGALYALVYTVLATSTLYARLRGISI